MPERRPERSPASSTEPVDPDRMLFDPLLPDPDPLLLGPGLGLPDRLPLAAEPDRVAGRCRDRTRRSPRSRSAVPSSVATPGLPGCLR